FLISDEKTLEKIIASGKTVMIAGETFIVPAPEHLVAMKLHSLVGNKKRELKDFPDIIQLMTANRLHPEKPEIKAIFTKYNALDIYNRVLAAMRATDGQ
ncbi:MAG: hypothetical protein PHC61_13420, partial [Chitinivibrionales bacterium]|nr:hypothetical protein [Chitinivibrionales bacterium]